LHLAAIETLETFAAFESWLHRPGPWVGGFDFPFGLPRIAVRDLGWPTTWPELARHCAALGRSRFRECLDAYRATRPVGDKYPYRRGDRAAGSHSPIKLVNPPVALMYLEGLPRLLAAGVHVPGLRGGDPERVALEAYPGFAVREILSSRARISYKNDAPGKQTPEQRGIRAELVRRISGSQSPLGVRLAVDRKTRRALVEDGSGDFLDAALCALQAARAFQSGTQEYGLPAALDPLEGWIATVPVAPTDLPFDNRSS
jgi:hypothetical protein